MLVANYIRIVREVDENIYDFERKYPQYKLNVKCVRAILMGTIQAEQLCDGVLLGFFKKGYIKKCPERLKEIDGQRCVRAYRECYYLFVI